LHFRVSASLPATRADKRTSPLWLRNYQTGGTVVSVAIGLTWRRSGPERSKIDLPDFPTNFAKGWLCLIASRGEARLDEDEQTRAATGALGVQSARVSTRLG
jgi:hypothetical protein